MIYRKYDYPYSFCMYQMKPKNEYEEKCPKCKGYRVLANMLEPHWEYRKCYMCNGTGVINWIGKIKDGKL